MSDVERRLVLGPGCMGEMTVSRSALFVRVERVRLLPTRAEFVPTVYRTSYFVMPFMPDCAVVDFELPSEREARREEWKTAMQWVDAGFADVREETDFRTLRRVYWAVLRVLVPDGLTVAP